MENKFVYVVTAPLVESLATLTMVAGFAVLKRSETVDSLGKNAGASGFSHTSGTTKEIGMRQLAGGNGIFEGRGERLLSHDAVECGGAVFARRNDILCHKRELEEKSLM